MDTILEQQRSYHEERERTMDAMVKEILHKKTGVRKYHTCIIKIPKLLLLLSSSLCLSTHPLLASNKILHAHEILAKSLSPY